MARIVKVKKEKALGWKDLTLGKCYKAILGSDSSVYYFIKLKGSAIMQPYIYENKYYENGNMQTAFSEYYETDDFVEEHIKSCIDKKKGSKIPENGKYVITLGAVNYDAAIESRGKIVWSEAIEPILHLIKEDLPIKTVGYSTKRPKTLKDLKKLIT